MDEILINEETPATRGICVSFRNDGTAESGETGYSNLVQGRVKHPTEFNCDNEKHINLFYIGGSRRLCYLNYLSPKTKELEKENCILAFQQTGRQDFLQANPYNATINFDNYVATHSQKDISLETGELTSLAFIDEIIETGKIERAIFNCIKYLQLKIDNKELFGSFINIPSLDQKVFRLLFNLSYLDIEKILLEVSDDHCIGFNFRIKNAIVNFDMYFEKEQNGFDSVFFIYKDKTCIANGEGSSSEAFIKLQALISRL